MPRQGRRQANPKSCPWMGRVRLPAPPPLRIHLSPLRPQTRLNLRLLLSACWGVDVYVFVGCVLLGPGGPWPQGFALACALRV